MHYLKYFFILFALGFYAQNLSAQLSYTPFPEGEAVWHVAYWEDECPIPFPCRFDQYAYKGDTMVNNLTYHRLYYTYQVFGEVTQGGYKGLIRQDTSQRKVYYFPSNSPFEHLLYDFNLQVGDTLPQTYNHNDNFKVSEIDTLILNGSYRKAYKLFPPNQAGDTMLIIEGIGATSGLINSITQPNGWEHYSLLTCFQDAGETIYSPYGDGNCIILGLEEQYFNIAILLNPNPVLKGQQIMIQLNSPNPFGIEFCDMLGNCIVKLQEYSGTALISTRSLNKGIYFVKVYLNGNIAVVKKLVIL